MIIANLFEPTDQVGHTSHDQENDKSNSSHIQQPDRINY